MASSSRHAGYRGRMAYLHGLIGKMTALSRLLAAIHATDEKVVVVSNWTTTLNLIQEMCKAKRYPFLRLDGSTAQKQRQSLVDEFNRTSKTQSFVFLLSAKAGGVGLNLIGWVQLRKGDAA